MKVDETKKCESLFSNGTEFEWFIETQCEKCTRFRNERCRVYNACCMAMWDKTKFPYDDLLDYEGGYAGKKCKHFTKDPIVRKKREHIINGQISFMDGDNNEQS